MSHRPLLIAVMGPTASGKTRVAEGLASEFDAQLINADAFQVYRGMDVGTAKPLDRGLYELLDLKEPNEQYGVGEFCQDAVRILKGLWESGRSAVLVGGTGLYIRALMSQYEGLLPQPDPALRAELQARLEREGLENLVAELLSVQPEAAGRVDLRNPVRVTRALERASNPGLPIKVDLPPFNKVKLGIHVDVDLLTTLIAERIDGMVQNGWVQEVRLLLSAGFGPGDPGFRAIGYSEIASHLLGRTDLEEAIAAATAETRRYAKRQRTWLRSEPSLVRIEMGDEALATAAQTVRAVYV